MPADRDDHSLIVSSDVDALMEAAASRVVELSAHAIKTHGRFTWALSGGSTPKQLYALLASQRFVSKIDWPRVHFFWGDERCVPPDHPDSNYRMVRESLLDVIEPEVSHVHRMVGEAEDPDQAARAYDEGLHAFFDVAPGEDPPSFDLMLLGMGADGHTASLFPGSDALNETRRWVVPNRLDAKSPLRLTMTLPIIDAASAIVFLIAGEGKASRLKDVLQPSGGAPLPAQRVQPERGRLQFFVDAAAAAKLELTR
ncbi:MAG TPA: 6-phosphogluconolactonase [Polyangiales bacterium]